jgi:hypothetical protein
MVKILKGPKSLNKSLKPNPHEIRGFVYTHTHTQKNVLKVFEKPYFRILFLRWATFFRKAALWRLFFRREIMINPGRFHLP